jgi:uncharacterized protein (DUF2236 family)
MVARNGSRVTTQVRRGSLGDVTSPHVPDLGFFGPDSLSWRVHGNLLLAIGGLRALFLQALLPRSMYGLAQNSDFRADPWGRLARTGDYIATVTFGSTDEARRAAARVRGIHRRLRGVDPRDGQEFRVDDPDLLRWTHVTEVESFVSTARRAGLVRAADVEPYYAEQLTAAKLVGLDPATVPVTEAAVADYYTSMRPSLAITPEAADAAAFIFWPRMPVLLNLTVARGGWLGVAALAFSLLPEWARRRYGALGLPVVDLPANLILRSLRGTLAVLPDRVRRGPRVREGHRRAQLAAGSGAGSAAS